MIWSLTNLSHYSLSYANFLQICFVIVQNYLDLRRSSGTRQGFTQKSSIQVVWNASSRICWYYNEATKINLKLEKISVKKYILRDDKGRSRTSKKMIIWTNRQRTLVTSLTVIVFHVSSLGTTPSYFAIEFHNTIKLQIATLYWALHDTNLLRNWNIDFRNKARWPWSIRR